MKVVYILHSSVMGGATISFVNMMFELKSKYGVLPIVICPKNIDHTLKGILVDNSINYIEAYIPSLVYSTKVNAVSFIKHVYHCVKSTWELRRIIGSLRPDIIHTNTGVIQQGFYVSKLLKIPHVWHLREYQDKDFKWSFFPSKKIFDKLLKRSYVITITKDILRYFNLSGSPKASCIYNGVLSKDEIVYNKEKKNYFLTASRISPEKGFEDILNAFGKYCQENDNNDLFILGNGPESYIQSLKSIINSYKCEDRVHFLGYKSLKEVSEYMRNAQALIVGSLFEGFGRMTAEAIMSGCLVIGRNTGGTKEILDQSNGLRFNDEDELFSHMVHVASTPGENSEMILDAQNKIRDLFTIEVCARNIWGLYERIVENEK